MKKLLALAVSLAISITAFPADTANAPDAHIKAEIAKRGTGEKARVRITTRDNRQMSGYIKEAGDSSFVLATKHSAETTRLAYSDVSRVRGPGLSTGAKVGIGVGAFAAGVGIMAAVILSKCHGYC